MSITEDAARTHNGNFSALIADDHEFVRNWLRDELAANFKLEVLGNLRPRVRSRPVYKGSPHPSRGRPDRRREGSSPAR